MLGSHMPLFSHAPRVSKLTENTFLSRERLAMASSSRSRGQGNSQLSNGFKKRPPALGWFPTIVIVGSILLAVGLFGYFFAHTHLTLGEYDKEIKFISNKIESIAKSSIEIPLHSLQQYNNLINHEKHIVEPYEIKNPDPVTVEEHHGSSSLDDQPTSSPTGSFYLFKDQGKAVDALKDILHLVRIREQPLPELIEPVIVVTNPPVPIVSAVIIPVASSLPQEQIKANQNNVVTSTAVTAPKNAGHVLQCPHGELLTFWRPPTQHDLEYETPFKRYGPAVKYVTFEPDYGGWNNIRMQMELVLVFAASTGRTLVLPPDQPMYLLHHGSGHQKAHNFADFFPFDIIKQRVPVITMEEYMAREAVTGNLKKYPPGNRTVFDGTDRDERKAMWHYLREVSSCPTWKSMFEFVIIPIAPGVNSTLLANASYYEKRRTEFSAERKAFYYDDYWQNQKFLHFISDQERELRLLEHFYTFIHFEDPAMERMYRRFVRDYVHYIDVIFCKAALIVEKMNRDSNGSFSTFHIRRGEFQYKEVKISAREMMVNVGHLLPSHQMLYIATDEKNKTFFDDFSPRFPNIKYLDDFMDYADLRGINPNYLGMIDQVVCSKGQYFVGTWFSTFSGYITRLRGYLGYHDYSVYYGDKTRRDRFHHFELPKFPFYMREWNISWYQIDVV